MNGYTRLLSVTLVLALAGIAAGQSAQQTFDQVFGSEFRKAAASHDPEYTLGVARKIYDASRKAEDQKELHALLCNKAYELASRHQQGYSMALTAMQQLAESAEGQPRLTAMENIAQVRQKMYNGSPRERRNQAAEAWIRSLVELADAKAEAGDASGAVAVANRALSVAASNRSPQRDEIIKRTKTYGQRLRAVQHIDSLQRKLAANPDDTAARNELIRKLIAEMNDIEAAQKLLKPGVDEQLMTYVPLAAKGIDQAPEQICQELGNWYYSLAQDATDVAKPTMLEHARKCLQTFLRKHKAEDMARTAAEMTLSKIETELASLAGTTSELADGKLILTETFEQKPKPGEDTWQVATHGNMAARISRKAGNAFAYFASKGGRGYCRIRRRMPVEKGWYNAVVYARVRAKGVRPGRRHDDRPAIRLFARDGDGRELARSYLQVHLDSEWTDVVETVRLPRGSRALDVELGMWNCGGELAIDDVRVYVNSRPHGITWKPGFPEGRFEKKGGLGLAEGWEYDPQNVQIVQEAGKTMLRLVSPDMRSSAYAHCYVRVDPKWEAVRMTARIRGVGLASTPDVRWDRAFIDMTFQSVEAVRLSHWEGDTGWKSSVGWTEVKFQHNVPDGASRIRIDLGMRRCQGRLEVEYIALEPIPRLKE